MFTIEISGENRFPSCTHIRVACRGILRDGDKILLTYERNADQFFLPGGGLENNESLKECCMRELAEETGLVVEPLRQVLTIREYYENWLYISHYFICKIVGETGRNLTEAEMEAGLEPQWLPLPEAIRIFSRHQEYADNEMKRGAYLREFRALSAYFQA